MKEVDGLLSWSVMYRGEVTHVVSTYIIYMLVSAYQVREEKICYRKR